MSNLPPQTGPEGQGPPAKSGDSGILSPTWNMTEPAPPGWQAKSKVAAGVLGILLGSIGVHSFYLGNAKKGVIQIVVSVVTCGIGGIWGFVEGIMILVGNVTTDAYGVPLTE